MGMICSTYGREEGKYKVLMAKPEERRPLRKLGHKWVENIKIDLQEIGWERVGWIHLAQDEDHSQSLVNMAMGLRIS
jgi:hypothetical protein